MTMEKVFFFFFRKEGCSFEDGFFLPCLLLMGTVKGLGTERRSDGG